MCIRDSRASVLSGLDDILDQAASLITGLPDTFLVVFMPYKAEMWDSMESIWLACREDPACECRVMPLPYYEYDKARGGWRPVSYTHLSYTNTMMVELGERLYFANGSEKNIKITTRDDFELFKAYLKMEKDNWLK